MMEPWYKIALPCQEVREGRSLNLDEFAIALEQVVAGTAPADYRDPAKFFSRTCFTRALCEHTGMVLRRLAGQTEHTAPVLTLITQFGGGKTHTLTTLYHLARSGATAGDYPGSAPAPLPAVRATTLRLAGTVPPEVWNRLGTRLLPKLRAGTDLTVGVEFVVTLSPELAQSIVAELRQILDDLGLTTQMRLEQQT